MSKSIRPLRVDDPLRSIEAVERETLNATLVHSRIFERNSKSLVADDTFHHEANSIISIPQNGSTIASTSETPDVSSAVPHDALGYPVNLAARPSLVAITDTTTADPVSVEKNERLDILLENLNRVGALGTLYWENTRDIPATNGGKTNALSGGELSGFFPGGGAGASPYGRNGHNAFIEDSNDGGTPVALVGKRIPEAELKEKSFGMEDSENWNISGKLDQHRLPGGNIVRGVVTSAEGIDLFAGRDFDLEVFAQTHAPLNNWIKDGCNSAGFCREFYITTDTDLPQIDLAWSIFPPSQGKEENTSAISVALLFKVGPNETLIPVAHEVLNFFGSEAGEISESVSGSASWFVEPGGHYFTALILVESGQTGTSGAILTLDAMVCGSGDFLAGIEGPAEENILFIAPDAAFLSLATFDGDGLVNGSAGEHDASQNTDSTVFLDSVFFPLGEAHDREIFQPDDMPHFKEILATNGLSELVPQDKSTLSGHGGYPLTNGNAWESLSETFFDLNPGGVASMENVEQALLRMIIAGV